MNAKVGFTGAGNMAEAIIRGVLAANILDVAHVVVSDKSQKRLAHMQDHYSIRHLSNEELLAEVDIVVIAVKPQVFESILPILQSSFRSDVCYVSIMAGVTMTKLSDIGVGAKIVRVMPNMPALIGLGMSVLSCSDNVDTKVRTRVKNIFQAVGKTLWVNESQMDVVTAVSGSGPAYVFRLAEAMIQAAVGNGLNESGANVLVKQTLKGAAELMMQSTDTPAELCHKVSSPGGTTLAGLDVLEQADLNQIMNNVVVAAKKRSEELGKE